MVSLGARRTTAREDSSMNNFGTKEQLKEMHLSVMAKEFAAQLNDPNTYSTMGFEDRFGLLVDAEWNQRKANKLARRIRDAHFSIPSACMEEIDYSVERKLDRTQLARFGTGQFIDDQHHIIIKGPTGGGKTYLGCAIGNAACRRMKSVRYTRMVELLDELVIARAENQFPKVIAAYSRVDLLILDDWLIRCLSEQETYDLLEIVESRTKHGATIFCTQYEKEGWYHRINPDNKEDSPIADAIMDRIVSNAYVVNITADVSMREHYGRAALAKDGGSH